MSKMLKRLMAVLVIVIFVLSPAMAFAADDPIVFKVAFTDNPTLKVGDQQVFHPSYAAMLAFQNAMDKYTNGKVKVELYPNGRLGDVKSNL